MKSDQSYCLGGRHYSLTINQNTCEKVNPKTKIIKGTCNICGRIRSKNLTK